MTGRGFSIWAVIALAALGPIGVGTDAAGQSAPDGRLLERVENVPPPLSTDDRAAAPPVAAEDIVSLLPLLVPLPEQKQLAGSLRALLERGRIKEAEQSLFVAVEVGVLASILLDWQGNPALLTALRDLPDSGPSAAAASPSKDGGDTEVLARERARTAALGEEISALKADLNAVRSARERDVGAAADSNALREDAKQQQRRAEEMAGALANVTQELAAMKEANARIAAATAADAGLMLQKLVAQEERADAASRDLAARIREIESLRLARQQELAAAEGSADELRHALARERSRAALAEQGQAETVERLRLQRLQAGMPRTWTEAAPSESRADGMVGILTAPPPVASTGAVPAPIVEIQAPPPVAPPPQTVPQSTARPAAAGAADDRLTVRADQLFRSGDVSGARLLLERTQEAGNAKAIFLLAETFDPNALAAIGARGIRGDPDRARELYRRALALGVAQADARIDALR